MAPITKNYRYILKAIKLNKEGIKTTCVMQDYSTKERYNLPIEEVKHLLTTDTVIKNALLHNNDVFIIPDNSRFVDMTNEVYGEWTVKEYLGEQYWKCECSCKKVKAVHRLSLINKESKSCGHATNTFKDMKDQQIEDWHVLEYLGEQMWLCECICGTRRAVDGRALRNGESKSCGHATNTLKDLKDTYIGEWSVKEYVGKGKWRCECSCGTIRDVYGGSLRNGESTSCGHSKPDIDLTNAQFGMWTVKKYAGHRRWLCECACKNTKILDGQMLREGRTLSCGCNAHLPKKAWQINAIQDEAMFNSILANCCISLGSLITLNDVAYIFNVADSTAKSLVTRYKSEGYIKSVASAGELELQSFLSFNKIPFELHNRTILEGKELDIYLPDYKLAIEYNGSYWHSDAKKAKDYHLQKTLACAKKGIHLIHIFDYEWQNSDANKKIKNYLLDLLNINQTIVYARDTGVKIITSEIADKFLTENHLQSTVICSVAIGLYYKEQLVQVATFGKPRFTKEYNAELLRLCSEHGVKVIGGASKLLNYYKRLYPAHSIVSYCDLSKFTGAVYESLGMTYVGNTSISYTYVRLPDLHCLHRLSCTKQKLLKQGYGTIDMTEEQIMTERGYVKVYNCGNSKYVYLPK